jgi:hypothetical protein
MQASVPANVILPLSRSSSTRRRRSYGRSRSYSRGRSYGRSRSTRRISRYQARAIARRAYVRAKWPSSEYAHIRVKRGSDAARALGMTSGAPFNAVGPEEQALRRQMQWYGNGGYFGRKIGSMFGQGDLGDKLGDAVWNAGKQFVPAPYRAAAEGLFAVTDGMNATGMQAFVNEKA